MPLTGPTAVPRLCPGGDTAKGQERPSTAGRRQGALRQRCAGLDHGPGGYRGQVRSTPDLCDTLNGGAIVAGKVG